MALYDKKRNRKLLQIGGMMKLANLLVFALLICTISSVAEANFEKYFFNKTMRVDFFHTGSKTQEIFSIDQIYEEGEWPGSKINLIDTLNYGEYLVKVFDVATNSLIFSRGYSTIFNEWQTTDEAAPGVFKTYHETVRTSDAKAANPIYNQQAR